MGYDMWITIPMYVSDIEELELEKSSGVVAERELVQFRINTEKIIGYFGCKSKKDDNEYVMIYTAYGSTLECRLNVAEMDRLTHVNKAFIP